MDGVGKGDRKTLLHVAAKDADVPLAYEVIRMGLTIDFKDKDGVTPLFLALENLLALNKVLKTVSQAPWQSAKRPDQAPDINDPAGGGTSERKCGHFGPNSAGGPFQGADMMGPLSLMYHRGRGHDGGSDHMDPPRDTFERLDALGVRPTPSGSSRVIQARNRSGQDSWRRGLQYCMQNVRRGWFIWQDCSLAPHTRASHTTSPSRKP